MRPPRTAKHQCKRGDCSAVKAQTHDPAAGGGNDRRPDTYVDLAPITEPDLVPVTVIRALGLPDQPGRSTMDTLLG